MYRDPRTDYGRSLLRFETFTKPNFAYQVNC